MDIKQIADLFDAKLDEKLDPIKNELKQHKRMLKSLKKDQDTMLDMLDGEQMYQRKRLKKIEEHLGFSTFAS